MKIILVGSSGAMGKTIQQLIHDDEELKIVAGIQEEMESDAFPVFQTVADLSKANIEADVMIDFSHVSLTDAVIDYASEKRLPVMLATTGQNDEQEQHIRHASEGIAILNAHNTSIGVTVMNHITSEMAKILYPLGYDIEIIEKHHRYKKDAPSGTAVMLKEVVQRSLSEETSVTYGREGLGDVRPHNEIAIHAIRGGDIVGEHTVLFANNQEVIELTHRAGAKEIFARGAITGARFLIEAKPGLYQMSDALNYLTK